MKEKTLRIWCFILAIIGFVKSEIFSTDLPYGAEVVSRPLYESNSLNDRTILLTDTEQVIRSSGHVIGFKYYHHEDVESTASSSNGVFIGIWRQVLGYDYQLVGGLDLMNSLSYTEDDVEVVTETGLAKIVYFYKAVAVNEGDIIGITISDATSPVAYSESSELCTYKEATNIVGYWPPNLFSNSYAFYDTTIPCRQYSLQTFVDITYMFSSCEFHVAPVINWSELISLPIISYAVDDSRDNYQNNMDICWIVRGPTKAGGLKIETSFFDLESGYDYLEVSYYDEDDWYQQETFSGSDGPDLDIASEYAKFRFTSDSSVTRQGFDIYFSGDYSSVNPTSEPSTDDDDTSIAMYFGFVVLALVVLVVFLVVCCYCCKCCCFEKKQKVHPQSSTATTRQGRPYPAQTHPPKMGPPPPYASVATHGGYRAPWMTASSRPGMAAPVQYGSSRPAPGYNNAQPPLHTQATGYYAYLQNEPSAPFGSASRAPVGFEGLQMEGTGRSPAFNDPAYPPQASAPPPVIREPSSGNTFNMADVAAAMAKAGSPKKLKSADGPLGRGQPKSEDEIYRGAQAQLNWQRTRIPGPADYDAPR